MEIAQVIILATCVICVCFCAAVGAVVAHLYYSIKYGRNPSVLEPEKHLTQEEFDKFAEADADKVDDFNSVIARLNAFMQGIEEDESNAGKQER